MLKSSAVQLPQYARLSMDSIALGTSTVCPKKGSHFYFLNNAVNNEPILIIFGTLNPEGT